MATRCVIVVEMDGEKSAIYRHSDGYPEGVLADIKTFMEIYHDPYGTVHGGDYWLANFVFYEKLTKLLESGIFSEETKFDPGYRWWEYGTGIIDPSDIDRFRELVNYVYTINLQECSVKIERWSEVVFEGTLGDAFEKFHVDEHFPTGCHIDKEVLAPVLAAVMTSKLKSRS